MARIIQLDAKQMTHMIQSKILTSICLSFTFLFVYAAVSKLIDFEQFQVQVAQSPVLTAFSHWIVWIIPSIEIIISLMLSVRIFRTTGLYASFGLMLAFTAYIVMILNFSEYIPCSCGGILARMNWTDHLIFNIIFTALALAGIIIQSRQKPEEFSLSGL